ncbi:MAG: PorV/PorQ family protein [Melioribacteraceae bacterium]|nr:PorV/PorQ family protein [Melioribacteraceae bacterium]
MKKFLIIIILFAGVVFGQSKTGTTAAPFLNMAYGPKAISMGGAFVATANDASAMFWNPAGLSRQVSSSAMFSQSKWIADIDYNWAGAMINLDGMGTLGLSIIYLDYGDMEVTTLSEQDGTGQMFSANDMSLSLSYAYNLTDRFSIGGNVKYIEQNIWNSSASTMAVDLGVLFISDIYGLRIGASISNFGGDMTMEGKDLLVQHDIDPNIYGNNEQILAYLDTDDYPLPLLFRVGIAMDVIDMDMHKLTLAADALHPNDNDESINVGAEYGFNNWVFFRAGFTNAFLDNAEAGLTLGAGLNYDFAPNFGIMIDYAYQDVGVFSDEQSVQHFSVGIRF